MKERPIIMTGDSVKGILVDRKTQTRRVIGKKKRWILDSWATNLLPEDLRAKLYLYGEDGCPYGKVGDGLWVRETFMFNKGADVRETYVGTKDEFLLGSPPHYLYRADDTDEVHRQEKMFKWRPSIFMPHKASRILLEITGVRVERLQEITEEDAIAEGIPPFAPEGVEQSSTIPRKQFSVVWDSINGKKHPWETNPWVWVISFRRVE